MADESSKVGTVHHELHGPQVTPAACEGRVRQHGMDNPSLLCILRGRTLGFERAVHSSFDSYNDTYTFIQDIKTGGLTCFRK